MAISKGNKRRGTNFRKARGYGMSFRFNNCECKSCKRSAIGTDDVRLSNKLRKLNKARTDVAQYEFIKVKEAV